MTRPPRRARARKTRLGAQRTRAAANPRSGGGAARGGRWANGSREGQVAPAPVRAALAKMAGGRVILTVHSLADMDAVASGLALAEFLGPQAVFALADRANSEARRLLGPRIRALPTFAQARAQDPRALIVLLDCNDPSLLPQLPTRVPIAMLIDHHALGAGSRRAAVEWVEPEAASCSELVAALIGRPSPPMARILIWGILSDSAQLGRADPRTLRTLADLLERADGTYEQIKNELRQPPSLANRASVLEGLRQAIWTEQEGLLLASASVGSHESHVADALVAAGADAAVVGSADPHGARISARLRPELAGRVDLPRIMHATGRFLGGEGGGHPAAAGANGPRAERLEEALILAQRLLAGRV